MPANVHIKKEPFLEMLSAATETFRKECLGWAFGSRPNANRKHYTITHIHHISRTRVQKNTEVQSHASSDRRLKKLFAGAPALYSPLGQFHSHNEWGRYPASPCMSDADIKSTIIEKTDIEIIIVVSSRKKGGAPWQVDPDGSITGSLGKYNFHFNIYTLVDAGPEKVPEKLHVVAPEAIRALNRAQKRMLKNKK